MIIPLPLYIVCLLYVTSFAVIIYDVVVFCLVLNVLFVFICLCVYVCFVLLCVVCCVCCMSPKHRKRKLKSASEPNI